MKYKSGVPEVECHPQLKVAEKRFEELFKFWFKEELTCTSTTDGKHMKGSKHYKNPHEARDYRFPTPLRQFLIALKFDLKGKVDFIIEKDHFHQELK